MLIKVIFRTRVAWWNVFVVLKKVKNEETKVKTYKFLVRGKKNYLKIDFNRARANYLELNNADVQLTNHNKFKKTIENTLETTIFECDTLSSIALRFNCTVSRCWFFLDKNYSFYMYRRSLIWNAWTRSIRIMKFSLVRY